MRDVVPKVAMLELLTAWSGGPAGREERGNRGNWQDTDFSSSVHQEAQTTHPVGNKEQATR